MKFLLQKLYEIKNIEIKKLTIWTLIGVGTLQLNNMWNVLATKINSCKEISFFDLDWWKKEIWEYSLTPSVIGISIAGIFWMNFIQVGAMNCIWSNIKQSLLTNDETSELKILIERLNKLEEELQQLKEVKMCSKENLNVTEISLLIDDANDASRNRLSINSQKVGNALVL